MKRAAAVTIAAAVFAAAIAFAQQPYFETFEVRLHNLDVVVTDAQGHPVRGLTKEDFEVLEDGKPQTITNFSVYDTTSSSVAGASDSAEAVSTPKSVEATPTPPPPRRFIFFVDDMGVQMNARRQLIEHATKMVDDLRPGDIAAVVRPTGENRIAQDYTTDHAVVRTALADAIESCKLVGAAPGFKELREFRNAMENAADEGERAHAKGLYATQSAERVRQRLGALRALIGSLAGVDGRKVLVLITSGLPSRPGREVIQFDDQLTVGERLVSEWGSPAANLRLLIDDLGRMAAANGVTIYALEPEVPLALGITKSAASRPVGSTQGSRGVVDDRYALPGGGQHAGGMEIMPRDMLSELLHYRGETLDSLTEKTGGKWFRGIATHDDVFRQVVNDLSLYYSLGYRATGTHNKPRRVVVKVRNRHELRVRTRSEVIDRSPEREMSDLTAANLLYPRALNELAMSVVTSGKLSREGKYYNVPVDVVIPLGKLTFLEARGGKYAATIDVHYAATGKESGFTTSGKHRQQIEINKKEYAARMTTNYRFKTAIQVPKGAARIAIGVMDDTSRFAGFRNLDVIAK